MRPPDRYLSTFDLPGIYISPVLLTLRLNAQLQGGWESNRAIAATRKVPRPRVPALCLGNFVGSNLAFCVIPTPQKLQILSLEHSLIFPDIVVQTWQSLLRFLAQHLPGVTL